ncbi:MAG: ATP-binding protein [Gaiellales bacterium]|nr:MAG: ATP-binding protein [Gaiellales bacterium]
MKKRAYWHNRIEAAWERDSLLWLSGVRQAGKTILGKSLDEIEYFNCQIPRIRRQMEKPRDFLSAVAGKRLVIDEIHRLREPSELLAAAADEFPGTRILATGPSAFRVSPAFRQRLENRVREIWLTPMMSAGLADFGNGDVIHRLKAGGLPPFFMSSQLSESEYQGWMDAYWARDIQARVRVSKHWSFQRFMEMLFEHSGEVFEAVRYAEPCGITHPTVANYLKILEETLVVHLVRPYTTKRPTEIVSAPRVYAFDTGFVCYYRGWGEICDENRSDLWRHFILNEIQSRSQFRGVRYWRDKSGHDVDFVLAGSGDGPVAIQCGWTVDQADLRSIRAFRYQYPVGGNWLVCQDAGEPYEFVDGGTSFRVIGLDALAELLETKRLAA